MEQCFSDGVIIVRHCYTSITTYFIVVLLIFPNYDVFVHYNSLLSTKFLPQGNNLPNTQQEAKKIITKLGLDYNSIHACENDCILFRGEYEKCVVCPTCGSSRYKNDKIPKKVLRHFPLGARIQHMFRTPELAKLMDWHAVNASKDNFMRIPTDCPAFKHIDHMWPEFKKDPRNLKLGVGLDGVNPFSMQSSKWSTWPVIIINYNLPPYLGIKKEHLILSLLIPGKRQVKDINVYLAPLINDLKSLWEGLDVIDSSKPKGLQVVTIRGIVTWTIHDYPGYGFCSGLGTKGYKACPICGDWLRSTYSKTLNKNVYLRHRRFLHKDHPLRMREVNVPSDKLLRIGIINGLMDL